MDKDDIVIKFQNVSNYKTNNTDSYWIIIRIRTDVKRGQRAQEESGVHAVSLKKVPAMSAAGCLLRASASRRSPWQSPETVLAIFHKT